VKCWSAAFEEYRRHRGALAGGVFQKHQQLLFWFLAYLKHGVIPWGLETPGHIESREETGNGHGVNPRVEGRLGHPHSVGFPGCLRPRKGLVPVLLLEEEWMERTPTSTQAQWLTPVIIAT
jgi:hypothetical protein